MKEGCCFFCEGPLPPGAKDFCDEECKDLNSRSLKTKKTGRPKDSMFTPMPSSPRDVVEQKKRFKTKVEPD